MNNPNRYAVNLSRARALLAAAIERAERKLITLYAVLSHVRRVAQQRLARMSVLARDMREQQKKLKAAAFAREFPQQFSETKRIVYASKSGPDVKNPGSWSYWGKQPMEPLPGYREAVTTARAGR